MKKYKVPIALGVVVIQTIVGLSAQNTPGNNKFLFVAHRGASYLAPENTLASLKLAWEIGADAAECDVMLTSDNQVILFHDSNTRKLTGKNLSIEESSWAELSSLTIKLKESNLSEYENEPIPLLEEVLEIIPADRMLVIEIKTGPGILPHLQKVIDNHWRSGKISFIAFDFETIKGAKSLYPDVPCYYLSSLESDFEKHLDAIVENKIDGVDLRYGIIDPELMKRCHKAGLEVWCWTVNDPETARNMRELGVTAVTTDRPAWLKENL